MSSRTCILKWVSQKLSLKLIAAALSLGLYTIDGIAQNNYVPKVFGTVNFSLGSPTLKPAHKQTVSLYGCNTRITIDGTHWSASDSLEWGMPDQILNSIPFGPNYDTASKKTFYVSKYYIAAPPVIEKPRFNIGKVIPDRFTMDVENQRQHIYFDYNRLILTQLKFVKVYYDQSFKNTGIKILPINIECDDFPWLDSTAAHHIGASGIGDLQRDSSANFSGLILPYYYNDSTKTDSTFLNCTITILEDIIPYHQVYFEVKGDSTFTTTKLNLTEFKDKSISLISTGSKASLPCGCLKPRKTKPCE